MSDETNGQLPELACPNCGENLVANGFYNYCSETSSLREDNHTDLIDGKLYMDHDESGHNTVDHECQMDAFCTSCDTLLPWALYQLRGLDGNTIAELLAELIDQPQLTEGTQPGEGVRA